MSLQHLKPSPQWLTIASLCLLTACGGGGGGGGGSDPVTPPASSASSVALLQAACSGAPCAAVNDTDYSGTGIGVWATSASASGRIGSFTLNNVSGKNVTLIWSNTDTVARSGLLSTASVVEGNSSAATRLREAMATTEHLLEGLLQKPANDKAPHFNISSTSTTTA